MDYRILLPVVRFVIKGKPLEQFFFAFKYSLECGNGQRFTKTTRTGEEIRFPDRLDQLPNIFGFIYVEIIFPT